MIDIIKEVSDAKRIGITGHVRPDGDCIGATLALYHYLKKKLPADCYVKVFLEEPADIFFCLPGCDVIETKLNEDEPFDVFFILDSVPDRTGEAFTMVSRASKVINIDHHISNASGSGDVNYVLPQASSTCEVLYELMSREDLDEEIAVCLYTGIIHDTGVMQYSNTSSKTLRIIADLVEFGFDFSKLIDDTFYRKTYIQNQILGRALLESILFMDGRCIVSEIDQKTMSFFGCCPKDMDGIVNQLRITTGVEVAIFMYETGTLEHKVSLRSNGRVDVSKIAEFFGGGGHVRAAGCTVVGTYHDAINNISREIAKQL